MNKNYYQEEKIGEMMIGGWVGTHNIDFSRENVVFDGYRDVFDLFAWLKRIRSNIKSF